MPIIGSIGEFAPKTESWSAYVERLEQFFEANDIAVEKQVATLLSVMGASTYGLLRNLVQPLKPKDKSYDDIVNILKTHFEPKPLLIAERFRFNRCNQRADESVTSYVAELKQCAVNCEFGETLNETLRDRFVSGICNEASQRRLLSESNLTFARAFEIALSMETAERDTQQLRGHEVRPNQVHKVDAHTVKQTGRNCHRCNGKNHSPQVCRFKDAKCYNCGKTGHIKRACRGKVAAAPTQSRYKRQTDKNTKYVEAEEIVLPMFSLVNGNNCKQAYRACFVVNGKEVKLEIDTGAAVSIISEELFQTTFLKQPLGLAEVTLKTYTGEVIPELGQFEATVKYESQSEQLPMIVVKGAGPALCGRNWLKKLTLNWKEIKHASDKSYQEDIKHIKEMPHLTSIQDVLELHAEVFKDELGTLRDVKATILVEPGARPKFCKSRPLPFAMKARVEAELDRLEKANIITPVKHSEWAAPVVPVEKKDHTIRLCGDYKLTVNQAATTETYPLPRIEELMATLSGGKVFSKIDLASAYQQVLLEEESKKLLTINTHRGLFVYNRLAFGVSAAPSIFQRIMENLMKDLNVVVYLDDLLITGKTEREHLQNLHKVLQRLQESGLRVRDAKCEFGKKQIEYLGHVLNSQGIQPSLEKVRAIKDAPAPTCVKELRAFLGLVNYYGRFMPNQSTVLASLYRLLKDQVSWEWKSREQKAFDKCKSLLTSDKILVHYDQKLPLTLACDSSAYGIGAVIQHKMPTGEERPIAFSSRTLSAAEKKYSQIEKEGLALIFGVKKFHQYLWGRKFKLVTDHKPLLTLFGEHKSLPTMAAARIQRWAIILSAYDYHIEYCASGKHGNADGLSRVPLPDTNDAGTTAITDSVYTLLTEHLEQAPLNADQVARATRTDNVLSKVLKFVMDGWPAEVDETLKAFHTRRCELSIERGCVLWGTRVVIPEKLRKTVLKELHSGHPGIVKMKALTRKYVWWPKVDAEVEQAGRACESCQLEQRMPRQVPLHPWEFPGQSWKRLHIDFAGPFLGHTFMLVVDAYSKWLEVFKMSSITSQATITRLRRLFAAYGLPEHIVTDNGTQFTSEEFKNFMQQNGILHSTSAPGHPASNGLAERYVQSFKGGMKKLTHTAMDVEDRVSIFLMQYRTTPNCTTGQSPADLFLNRHVRTRLDFIRPDTAAAVRKKQYKQKFHHDLRAADRCFSVDDPVYLYNTAGGGRKWIPGVIVDQTGPVSYKVQGGDTDITYRRHGDQLRYRVMGDGLDQDTENSTTDTSAPSQPAQPEDMSSCSEPGTVDRTAAAAAPLSPRRSSRVRKPPDRYVP
ncbi:ER membrane protein complex subunit 2 isoform X1 [Rhinoraja longicauda]